MAVNIDRTSKGSIRSLQSGLVSSMDSAEAFDVGDTKVQHYGLLMKKPFGHKSGRWQKRFFIVKEGFLLYYPESEGKAFERAHTFNIHPKGVIPLAGCEVEEGASGSQKFPVKITHQHFKGEIWLGADNREECTEWIEVLKDAGKVTWRNAQFGEKIIIQMEEKSRETATELKQAIDSLNEKASVLEEEKEKKSELEALAAKLEKEKQAVEDAAKSLRMEKDTVQQELQQTLMSVNTIQEEKDNLFKATEELQSVLQVVSKEKEQTTAELQERERLARELEEEKQHLEETTSHLKAGLLSMEERQRLLEEEKQMTVEQLRSQEEAAKQLESEKRKISDTAQNLKANLQQVAQEKETTESKWKEERQRRIRTEKRLRLAEDSLKRLDRALKESGVHIDIQIETDVKHLKRFFEDCIAEEQFEAQKLDIMRDAVRAKATYSITTRNLENTQIHESVEPPSSSPVPDPLPTTTPPNAAVPDPLPTTTPPNATVSDPLPTTTPPNTTVPEEINISSTPATEGSEVVANGDATTQIVGNSSVIAEGSEVVGNGTAAASDGIETSGDGLEVVANGNTTSEAVEVVATTSETVEGSEVVANGDATSESVEESETVEGPKVVDNDASETGSEVIPNGNVTMPNGIPATV